MSAEMLADSVIASAERPLEEQGQLPVGVGVPLPIRSPGKWRRRAQPQSSESATATEKTSCATCELPLDLRLAVRLVYALFGFLFSPGRTRRRAPESPGRHYHLTR